MSQTTTTTAIQPVDLEALRLQLKEDGKFYRNNRNPNPEKAHERLLHTLQRNDCREIMTAVVDRDYLAIVFVLAANRNHVDIVEAFLDLGMNINVNDEHSWTALMYSSCNKHEQCVRFLLDHNAKVDIQDKCDYSALMIASMNGFTKIVEMLLEKNANPDFQTNDGKSALMIASQHSFREVVQLLLNHNADIDLKNNNGKTALELAQDEEIKEMLRNYVSTSYVLK